MVLRRRVDRSRASEWVERLGTVAGRDRLEAWERVKHEPDRWLGDATHLGLGEVVELGLLPESAWPEFESLCTRPRLESAL